MLKRDPKRLFLRYARKGDAAALGKVFDALAPELLGLALHLTRRTDLAEDVLQDTFLAAAGAAQRFDPSRPFRPWIIGILVNRARKVREALATSRHRSVEDDQLQRAPHDGRHERVDDPGKEAEASEVQRRVASAIESLDPPYREVVDAHLTDGLAPRDIAPVLGRAPGTVRVQLHRGLGQLRDLLGAKDGLGGLEMLSLAPTSSLMLSSDVGRGLAAIRAEVLASLPKGVALSTGSAGATGAAAPSYVVAAGAAALTGGVWLAVHFGGAGASPDPSVSEVVIAPAEPAPGPPTLSEVPALPNRVPSVIKPSSPPAGRAASSGTSGTKSRTQANTKAELSPTAPPPETYEFRIEPSIDRTAIETFNAFAQCRFHARSSDYQTVLGAGSGVFNDFRGFNLGSFESVDALPNPLIVHFDHPLALPCEVLLDTRDWSSHSRGYVARPVLHLKEIADTIAVRGGVAKKKDGQPSLPFEGEALLISIDLNGTLRIQDRQELNPKRGRTTILRAPEDLGNAFVLGLPRSENLFSDVAEATPVPRGRTKGTDSVAVLRPRIRPPITISVNDPFGRPMADLPIRAVVPKEAIFVRNPETEEPILIDGRVFCGCLEGDLESYGASAARGGTIEVMGLNSIERGFGKQTLLAAYRKLEGTTDAKGEVTMTGLILGLHRLEAMSPMTGAWTAVTGQAKRSNSRARSKKPNGIPAVAFRVTPPVAGLEVECPSELRTEAGAWTGGRIEVSAGDFKTAVKPKTSGKVRILVPPNEVLIVRLISGEDEFSTLSRGVNPGGRHLVVPLGPNPRRGTGATKD